MHLPLWNTSTVGMLYPVCYQMVRFAVSHSLGRQPKCSSQAHTNSLYCLQSSGKRTIFVLLTMPCTNLDAHSI